MGSLMFSGAKLSFTAAACTGLFVRFLMVLFGEWQDSADFSVKYTDIDYWVFTDGAKSILEGGSPYSRATFRYSPVMAALMLPAHILQWPSFGKFLFCVADIFVGLLIYKFLLQKTTKQRALKLTTLLWFLNPLSIAISTRGNAESLVSLLSLSSIWLIYSGRTIYGSIIYGFCVHFKIFPAIYSASILVHLATLEKRRRGVDGTGRVGTPTRYSTPVATPMDTPTASPTKSPNVINIRKRFTVDSGLASPITTLKENTLEKMCPTNNPSAPSTPQKSNSSNSSNSSKLSLKARFFECFKFSFFSALGFLIPSAISFYLYRDEYLNEGILYHLTRQDHRHNFSPYFYMFYTREKLALLPSFQILAFIPQFLMFLAVAFKFGKKDLPFACFISTFLFVTFNKVITSQYFIWYAAFFPMAVVSLRGVSMAKWALMFAAWAASQATWLHFAYKLEFLGQQMFASVWACSLVFLLSNVWLAGEMIGSVDSKRFNLKSHHPGVLTK